MEREGIVKIAIPISVKTGCCKLCIDLFSSLTAYMYMHYKSFNREPITSFPWPHLVSRGQTFHVGLAPQD